MKKSKIASIICGIGIVITTVIMIIRLEIVARKFYMHPEWSLGVVGAVKITAMFYGIIICIFTIVLVLVNVLKKSN